MSTEPKLPRPGSHLWFPVAAFAREQQLVHLNGLLYLPKKQVKSLCTFPKSAAAGKPHSAWGCQ